MNGYRTEPRRRFSQNRHPVDIFSGYDDNEFHQPQPQTQQNNFVPIRDLSHQEVNGISQDYRSGRSSVPAHLLNSKDSEPIFNRTHPSPAHKVPFIDPTDFNLSWSPKQILDSFQKQSDSWFPQPVPANSWTTQGHQPQIDNWSKSNNNSPTTKVPWRQNNFQSISDNTSSSTSK